MYHVCTVEQWANKKKPYGESYRGNLLFNQKEFNLKNFPIDGDYRVELKELIVAMMQTEYAKRPSATEILTQIEDWPRFKPDMANAKDIFADLPEFAGINAVSSSKLSFTDF